MEISFENNMLKGKVMKAYDYVFYEESRYHE